MKAGAGLQKVLFLHTLPPSKTRSGESIFSCKGPPNVRFHFCGGSVANLLFGRQELSISALYRGRPLSLERLVISESESLPALWLIKG